LRLDLLRDIGTEIKDEFAFLIGSKIDSATIDRARDEASRCAMPVHRVLIAKGWVLPHEYVRQLALELEVRWQTGAEVAAPGVALVDAIAAEPAVVRATVEKLQAEGRTVVLGSDQWPSAPRNAAARARAWLTHAVDGLYRQTPQLSARGGAWLWQQIAVVLVLGAFIGMALIDTPLAYFALSLVAAIPFAFIVAQRVAVLFVSAAGLGRQFRASNLVLPDDRALPVCTVLVPLFREAEVLPDLVHELSRLDYPAAKLDILIILEEVDSETLATARRLRLPGFMRIVVVPDAQPRTKPKAMNYAFQYARGSFVAVYDAEDVPDRRQLRRVQAVFAAGPDNLGCVQAKLNIHNRGASWFARQFTLEYTALFDGMLPALKTIGTPLMLGGTSNHFRRSVLERIGGWDPYNVTEDADLGIRMERAGYQVAVLDSTTWEEAPETLGVWLPQRTRWLKGWMQTYLVHMRRPLQLLADLGAWRFLMLQCLLGGFLLSALLHPLFYLLLVVEFTRGQPFQFGGTGFEVTLWYMASFNLAAGFVSAMLLAAIAAVRRGYYRLLFEIAFMPAYWLLISLAAYRAVWQLLTAPHMWEKTRHSARRRGPLRSDPEMKWPGRMPGHS
jgi:glycosyltransferase XagB